MSEQLHYAMVIQWSDEDSAYVVSFPEWEAYGLVGHTHGSTYEDATRNGREVLDMLVRSAREDGESLPAPRTFDQRDAGVKAPTLA